MKNIKSHFEQLKEVANRKREYNPQSNLILRKGLWFSFQRDYERLYGHPYDHSTREYQRNIGVLLSYFTASEIFTDSPALVTELNEPSLNKGLLIIGGYGNGKTSSMNTLNHIMTAHQYSGRFKMVNSRDIVQEFETMEGTELKKQFWNRLMVPVLCIDDVLKERKASNYGLSEVVGEILLTRYNKGLKTHITCNYKKGDQSQDLRTGLQEFARYGEHFYDRIFEMFNIVQFKGKSKRN